MDIIIMHLNYFLLVISQNVTGSMFLVFIFCSVMFWTLKSLNRRNQGWIENTLMYGEAHEVQYFNSQSRNVLRKFVQLGTILV